MDDKLWLESGSSPFFSEIAFGIYRCTASGASCSNSLAVGGICHITTCKDTLHVGFGGGSLSYDIAHLVERNVIPEDLGIGLVADGQEEPIHGDVIPLFIGFTQSFYQVYPFYSFSPKRPSALCSKRISSLGLFITRSCMIFVARR